MNGDVNRDWSEFERETGVRFPIDYKEFISAYGPGCVNDELLLFHPRAVQGDLGLRLRDLMRGAGHAYSVLMAQHPEFYPCPVYPHRAGCIPVGRTSSGNHLLLLPPESGEKCGEWAVLMDMGGWARFDMSFSEFLVAALRHDLFLPVLEGDPGYEVVGDVA